MKIGKSEYYAIILVNALKESGHKLTEVSDKYKIPEDFLYKVALKMKKSGLILSKEGVNGGYSLARPIEQISLYDILAAFRKESYISCDCADEEKCVKHSYCEEYTRIQQSINEKLKEINL